MASCGAGGGGIGFGLAAQPILDPLPAKTAPLGTVFGIMSAASAQLAGMPAPLAIGPNPHPANARPSFFGAGVIPTRSPLQPCQRKNGAIRATPDPIVWQPTGGPNEIGYFSPAPRSGRRNSRISERIAQIPGTRRFRISQGPGSEFGLAELKAKRPRFAWQKVP